MKKLIMKNAIEREKGYMYYIDGEGSIWGVKMKTGGTKGSKHGRDNYYSKKRKLKRKKGVKKK